MSDMIAYKCPSCGGRMEFHSGLQKMKCPYCDTEMEVEAYESLLTSQQTGDGVFQNAGSDEVWQESEISGMKVYSCQACGGELIADETTGASSCPYCGNRVMMQGQFSGGLRPDLIIPFKHNKIYAKEAYLSHLKGKPFLPKIFQKENHIDEIKGIYVPFWVFNADVEADCVFHGKQISQWTSGNTRYTETKYFKINRGGTVRFHSIPTDASQKMDDALMESIEPFNAAKAVPFKSAYLSGYLADRYDVEASERFDRARERIRISAIDACESTVKGYHGVTCEHDSVKLLHSQYRYALFPVWILNTTWRGKQFTFALNDQTGKMTGDLPMNLGAFVGFVLGLGSLIGAVLYGLMWVFV